MLRRKKICVFVAFFLVLIIGFFADSFPAHATTTRSATTYHSAHTLKSAHTLGGPAGCPTALPLINNSETFTYANRTSYLLVTLWGWFTEKLNDTQGEEYAFCNQVYCTAEIYGAFISGNLTAYCNYSQGKVVRWIGGTASGQTNGYQITTTNQVTSQISVGIQCWAGAIYQPAGTSAEYLVETSRFYHLPGWQ